MRTGRSSSVTLPNALTASLSSAESAPGRVSTRTGKSDHGGCSSSILASSAPPSNDTDSSGISTAAAPLRISATSAGSVETNFMAMPEGARIDSMMAASLGVGVSASRRRSLCLESTFNSCPL
jgi:hypothetical protein